MIMGRFGQIRPTLAHDHETARRETGIGVLALGLTARMMAECIPGAAWAVNVTDASANPVAASLSRYSARDSAPALPVTENCCAFRSGIMDAACWR